MKILVKPHVLKEFGFSPQEYQISDFQKKDSIVRIGFPPFRIDLIISIDGVEFKKCYQNRVEKELDGVNINFIGYKDLIKNKKASGRKKDLDDLELLED